MGLVSFCVWYFYLHNFYNQLYKKLKVIDSRIPGNSKLCFQKVSPVQYWLAYTSTDCLRNLNTYLFNNLKEHREFNEKYIFQDKNNLVRKMTLFESLQISLMSV